MKKFKNTNYTALFAILGTTTLVITAASFLIIPVEAKANSEHSNPVGPAANTNGPYMKDCKEHVSAKDCATGPGNNGDYTSETAHENNGP
jgi:invasion protein IalB